MINLLKQRRKKERERGTEKRMERECGGNVVNIIFLYEILKNLNFEKLKESHSRPTI